MGPRKGAGLRVREIAVDSDDGFYDYKTKYQAHDAVTLTTPANIERDPGRAIQEVAVHAFEVLDVKGCLSRLLLRRGSLTGSS